MTKVLKADCSASNVAYVQFDLPLDQGEVWLTFDLFFDAAALAVFNGTGSNDFGDIIAAGFTSFATENLWAGTSPSSWALSTGDTALPSPALTANVWRTLEVHYVAGTQLVELYVDSTLAVSGTYPGSGDAHSIVVGQSTGSISDPDLIVYLDNVKISTTRGGDDLFSDDFESGNLGAWTSTTGDVSVVDDPLVPVTSMVPGRRVGIAFNDGPLEPDPTWIWLDDTTMFPPQFVAGYDTKNGRQTLISQTETGTATVYVNDRAGLFDNRNLTSPYAGNLVGRQMLLQLWNPVTLAWEPQFRGLIDDYSYDIDGSAVDANGDPINASIQIEAVDIFDYLNGYELTPGLDGQNPPPTGMEDGVWYAPTSGGVQDRFIEILTDAGIDSSRYDLSQGNVNVIGVKYDVGDSALEALRDAADAELPFIANIYVDRYGRFIFRGRYARFNPDFVSSEPGSDWDFQRWPLGDGKAIQADPTRGQMRVLSYIRSRKDLINKALAYPQGIAAADMPGQVYASTASILANGAHSAPPMGDLLTCEPTGSGYDKLTETAKFAELLVENKKAPRLAITRLQLKSMRPDDPRASATWGAICGADISHIVNVAVGYPGGLGLTGDSPVDDHYVEGRSLTVRPLNPVHDYVECDLEVSPALWSMDADGVFPVLA